MTVARIEIHARELTVAQLRGEWREPAALDLFGKRQPGIGFPEWYTGRPPVDHDQMSSPCDGSPPRLRASRADP